MLTGPAPKYAIKRAAPVTDRSSKKKAIIVCFCIGSAMFQKGCIIKFTGIRKANSSQPPHLALYPIKTLSPPKKARMPEAGTRILARGTPDCCAYPMAAAEKRKGADIKKCRENKILPANG